MIIHSADNQRGRGLRAVIKLALISLALACWWHAVSSRSTLPKEDKPGWEFGCEGGSVGSHCARAGSSHTYLSSVSPNSVSVHYFVTDSLTPCSRSLSGVYLAHTEWQKVCACVDLCVF